MAAEGSLLLDSALLLSSVDMEVLGVSSGALGHGGSDDADATRVIETVVSCMPISTLTIFSLSDEVIVVLSSEFERGVSAILSCGTILIG
jgi:hypothetical protein